MADLKLFSTLGVVSVLDELLPRLGLEVDAVYEPTKRLVDRIQAGERADLAILTSDAIDELTAAGVLASGSRVDLARSHVGMAVAPGAARPDISTVEAFRQTLLAAGTIGYSRAGASGIFFAGLLERMGLAAEVNAKATVIPSGFTGQLLLDGKVELAVQQVSELMAVPGIDILGRIPKELQPDTIFSAGLFAETGKEREARDFVAAIAGPSVALLYVEKGLEPV
ncbi:substrate-binding domain-containing protein [Roseococcus sp. SYP-B2431]|uniref:substrate-binding domain-containing protein n=1 Tax=Roseococcus sp. SYP-B2431 TaxID=2496640 RepID=UPI0013F4917A|nr:substrate-binding domain-containing protein [Roseococcus sp. SYP-B2431]